MKNKKKQTPPKFSKNIFSWVLIALTAMAAYSLFTSQSPRDLNSVSYSEFLSNVNSGDITSVVLQNQEITAQTLDGKVVTSYAPTQDSTLVEQLKDRGIDITVKPAARPSVFTQLLLSLAPVALFIGIWIFFMRQMMGGGNKAFSFGKSKAKMDTSTKKVTFDDVAGIDEAKEELEEIIDFLRAPAKFQKLGGKIPKGVLLIGPPGTGKTLLARAVAGEADVPFFNISGSDFVEMFVGVGASRVRDLFEQGKKNAPCIIFIDEIDAVGRQRGAGLGGGHDEREQTLNQMLVEMDGFDGNEGIILIAATNRPDVLDPALLRPGRFDRQVNVPPPDILGREAILNVHAKNVPTEDDVDMKVLARGTPGFAGAELANLVNEAALLAARHNKDKVSMEDLENSKDKVMMGKERRSMVMGEQERIVTAYHEAGHAIVAKMVPDSDPVHKVSIIPRGMALGITMQLPSDDRYNYSDQKLHSMISILMAGRIAEEITFGEVTTGASNDIERATSIARKMVCAWGMSRLGTVAMGSQEGAIFLGRELANHSSLSPETAREVDIVVNEIITDNYNRAKEIMKQNSELLVKMSDELLEHETINADDVNRLVDEFATGDIYDAFVVHHKEVSQKKAEYDKITEVRRQKAADESKARMEQRQVEKKSYEEARREAERLAEGGSKGAGINISKITATLGGMKPNDNKDAGGSAESAESGETFSVQPNKGDGNDNANAGNGDNTDK